MRVAADYRKRAHVRKETPVAELPEAASPPGQLDAVERRQARALLDRALAELDDDKRRVFVLFELEDWPMAEVAKAVGCPVQTAYARLYAAREQVQAKAARLTSEGGQR